MAVKKAKERKTKKTSKSDKKDAKQAAQELPGLIFENAKFSNNEKKQPKKTKQKPEEEYSNYPIQGSRALLWFGVIVLSSVVFFMWIWNAGVLMNGFNGQNSDAMEIVDTAKADIGTMIDELKEDNNEATISMYVHSGDLIPIYPIEYGIYPDSVVVLMASTAYPFISSQNCVFEFDTSDAFNPPLLTTSIKTTNEKILKLNTFQYPSYKEGIKSIISKIK